MKAWAVINDKGKIRHKVKVRNGAIHLDDETELCIYRTKRMALRHGPIWDGKIIRVHVVKVGR